MLADELIPIFLFAISNTSGRRNSIPLLFLTSSSVILLGFSSGLDVIKYQHSSKPLTLGAIMKIRLILVFQLLFTVCNGQTSYYKQNDSTVSELYKHFSICQTLKSSRPIDKKKVDIDRSVVRFCNDLYNGAFTKRDLETLIKKFTKTIHDQTLTSRKSDSLEEIAFTLYSNGNLQVSYSAVLIKDSIISFKIFIGTNTQVDCNASGNTVQYFDFVYLKSYFLKEIDFPLLLKPLTADLILSNKMN